MPRPHRFEASAPRPRRDSRSRPRNQTRRRVSFGDGYDERNAREGRRRRRSSVQDWLRRPYHRRVTAIENVWPRPDARINISSWDRYGRRASEEVSHRRRGSVQDQFRRPDYHRPSPAHNLRNRPDERFNVSGWDRSGRRVAEDRPQLRRPSVENWLPRPDRHVVQPRIERRSPRPDERFNVPDWDRSGRPCAVDRPHRRRSSIDDWLSRPITRFPQQLPIDTHLPRPDERFNVSGWNRSGRPDVEEHLPRRRSSVRDWLSQPSYHAPIPMDERVWPRRRSSCGNPFEPIRQPPPIVLPTLPTKRKTRSSKKKLYFVRPHDGDPEHRRGTLGRFKDALTGEGPDVFVTATTPDRLMRDRPQRWQWTNGDLSKDEILTKIVEPGFAWSEFEPVREAPWAERGLGDGYDFRARRYGGGGEDVWTDARWKRDARKGSWPEKIKDAKHAWWERVL